MARVVQQRTGPSYLYLVVVFVFIALISLGLAIWMYLNASETSKTLADTETKLKALASSSEMSGDSIEKMMDQFRRSRKTVVRQLLNEQDELTKLITGNQTTPAAALAQAKTALDKPDSKESLVPELLDLAAQLKKLGELAAQQKALLGQKQQELASKDQAMDELDKTKEQQLAELRAKVQQMDGGLQQMDSRYKADLDQAQKDWERKRQELNINISKVTRTALKLEDEVKRLRKRVEELLVIIRKATAGEGEAKVALKPDAKILKVSTQGDVCYISIGALDRVTTGLTFSVYPPSGVTDDGQGKATIRVTSVLKNTSECRVVSVAKGETISLDDPVANVAFDPTQTFTFAVEGQFDLYGMGRATSEGAEDTKAMIRRAGGIIADEINVETDFIVMGAEPTRPAKPEPTAGAQEWQVYREQLKVSDRYADVLSKAEDMQIPVFNTNKFLAFMGYTPSKTDL